MLKNKFTSHSLLSTILLVAFILLFAASTKAQNVNTIAGTGTAGYSGDGGAATSAQLGYATGVAVDAAGNIYIADQSNQRIRKINTIGIISTMAGNGTQGFSGDGGAATSAELNSPEGVAVDAAGNIYIADYNNHRIRKVSTSGTISTVAGDGTQGRSGNGGAATSAELDHPTGVAVDAAGNIYIADYGNHAIRQVNASSGGNHYVCRKQHWPWRIQWRWWCSH